MAVSQWVEGLTMSQNVGGSIPSLATCQRALEQDRESKMNMLSSLYLNQTVSTTPHVKSSLSLSKGSEIIFPLKNAAV